MSWSEVFLLYCFFWYLTCITYTSWLQHSRLRVFEDTNMKRPYFLLDTGIRNIHHHATVDATQFLTFMCKICCGMFCKCLATFIFMKRNSLMLCTAAVCFHHKPFVTFHQANFQTNSPLGVEVNSEAYSCIILRIFKDFRCLTLSMIRW